MWRAPTTNEVVALDAYGGGQGITQGITLSLQHPEQLNLVVPQHILTWSGQSPGIMMVQDWPAASDPQSQFNYCPGGIITSAAFCPETIVATGSAGFVWMEYPCVRVVSLKIVSKAATDGHITSVRKEVRVLERMIPAGFGRIDPTWHQWEWDHMEDEDNYYIAIDIVRRRSVAECAPARIAAFEKVCATLLRDNMGFRSPRPLAVVIQTFVGRAWMHESLRIFGGVLECLRRLHERGVCYLDIKMENLIVDSAANVRLLRSGKSDIMDAGRVDITNREALDPCFAPPELLSATTDTSFFGAAVDMWAAGVLLYQLVFSAYRGGLESSQRNGAWIDNLLAHAGHPTFAQSHGDTCLICRLDVQLPPSLYSIFLGLLQVNPVNRSSAAVTAALVKEFVASHSFDAIFLRRAELLIVRESMD